MTHLDNKIPVTDVYNWILQYDQILSIGMRKQSLNGSPDHSEGLGLPELLTSTALICHSIPIQLIMFIWPGDTVGKWNSILIA